MTTGTILLLTLFALRIAATYYPLIQYSGTTFFDGFDFYGAIDNTTWGNVTFVNQTVASSASLAYVNDLGHAIIKVDNTTTVVDQGIQYRNSIRLTSKAEFPVGTLFVIDALHLPFGCSVWPSVWFNGILGPGEVWPAAGEIDWIEGINLMDHNQMALHSTSGCAQPPNVVQTGQSIVSNCDDPSGSGCSVAETKLNSFGAGFNQNGGGAFGLQFDVAGVFMWFWNRSSIPNSIISASFNPSAILYTSDWGTPSAAYPASGCNITEFFPNQLQLMIDITLCGLWAGLPSVYAAATGCPGAGTSAKSNTDSCFAANIAGDGSNYAEAYFEIPAIHAFTVNQTLAAAGAGGQTIPSLNSVAGGGQPTSFLIPVGPSKTGTAEQSRSTGTTGGSPARERLGVWGWTVAVGAAVVLEWLRV